MSATCKQEGEALFIRSFQIYLTLIETVKNHGLYRIGAAGLFSHSILEDQAVVSAYSNMKTTTGALRFFARLQQTCSFRILQSKLNNAKSNNHLQFYHQYLTHFR